MVVHVVVIVAATCLISVLSWHNCGIVAASFRGFGIIHEKCVTRSLEIHGTVTVKA